MTTKIRSEKNVTSPLAVYAWVGNQQGGGFRWAGTLVLDERASDDDSRSILANFRYADSYLNGHPAGRGSAALPYPLDPINMPLLGASYATQHAHVVLGAIFDAAPDAWGRRVIHAAEPGASADGEVYGRAFLRGADGIGALLLTPAGTHAEKDPTEQARRLTQLVQISQNERPGLDDINQAARAARALEAAQPISADDQRMLAGSWTIGGARPKAILRNTPGYAMTASMPGRSVIAKFPSIGESVDRAAIEWACLRMAADIGMPVPGHALANTDLGQVLVLERFDRYALPTRAIACGVNDGNVGGMSNSMGEGRRHYVSANSLVSSLPQSKRLDTAHDQTIFSFGNLISIAGRVSHKPTQAKLDMYARLLLNTALHNTDDHLKNFGFVSDDVHPGRLTIAPVFDVSPQSQHAHYVHLHNLGRHYTVPQVLAHARAVGIAESAAQEVWDRIAAVLERRFDYYDQAGLDLATAEKVEALINLGTGGVLGPRTPRPPEQSPAEIAFERPS